MPPDANGLQSSQIFLLLFTMHYPPEKENIDADSCSRMPVDLEAIMRECTEELSSDCLRAMIHTVETQNHPDVPLVVACESVPACVEGSEGPLKPLSKEENRLAHRDGQDI